MTADDEHEEQDGPPNGAPPFEGLGAFLNAERAHYERDQLRAESAMLRVHNWFDTLDVEGLMVLRKLLHADPNSVSNHYFDGMITTLLRVVHHVDPDTGKSWSS